MEPNLLKIFLLFIFFHISLNYEQKINCFTSITIWDEENNFYYQFENSDLQEDRDAYFFFKFYDSWNEAIIQIKIIDENQNEAIIGNITSQTKTWISYKLTNLESQKYSIKITSNEYAQMFFIDNTKEIKTNLKQFIYFNFTTNDLVGDKPPFSLIFNIDTIEEDSFYNFIEISKDKISDGENLLEFCIIDENDCSYKGIEENFNFEKGNRYKIRLNPYKKDDNNLFYFKTFYFMKEMDFGLDLYESSFTEKICFLIINVKNNKNFYIYFDGKSQAYYSFLSENERKLFPDNLNSLTFTRFNNSIKQEKIDNMKGNNFILVEIYNSYKDKYIIGVLNIFYLIDSYKSLEIEKGNKAGIFIDKEFYNYNSEIYVVSSNKNMQIADHYSYIPGNYSNILYILKTLDGFIYIDSILEKTKIKFSQYKKPINDEKFQFNFVQIMI